MCPPPPRAPGGPGHDAYACWPGGRAWRSKGHLHLGNRGGSVFPVLRERRVKVQSKTPPEGGASTVPSTPDDKKKSHGLIRGKLPKFQPHQPQPPGAVPQKPQKPRSSERRRRAPRHPLLLLQGHHPRDLEPVARTLAHTHTHTEAHIPPDTFSAGLCWLLAGSWFNRGPGSSRLFCPGPESKYSRRS